MAFVINQPNCSCCHRCALECPVHAISMKDRKYWIDPKKCVSCGQCAARCHNGAIHDPNASPPEVTPHERKLLSCDVLVIGGGGAGLVAAAKAIDQGCSVIVLEKNHEPGGSAYFGHMMSAHYSKWHEQAGAKDPRPQLYEDFVKTVGNRVNLKLVKRCLDANSALLDWLIDCGELEKGFKLGPGRFGMEYDLIRTFTDPLDALRSDPSIGPMDTGSFITTLLADKIHRTGGTILCGTEATQLMTEGSRVVGALARDSGGELAVRAKSTVVTAGTYSRNREIMDKMQPLFYHNFEENPIHIYACATCTGDGITMCDEIGADIDYENRRSCMFGPVHHPFSFSAFNIEMYSSASEMLVNRNGSYLEPTGKMGMSEIGILIDQPGRMAWSIIDQQCLDEAVQAGLANSDPDTQMSMRHWERDWNTELRDGSIIRADSITELAHKLGCSEEELTKSFARQRAYIDAQSVREVDNAEDNPLLMMLDHFPDPHQLHAPYYAIFMGMFQENAIGGMTIDENTAVLRGGVPIPNLYAAGDNTRGIMLPGDVGVSYIENVLSAMTFAMCSGYIAGEEAAKNAVK